MKITQQELLEWFTLCKQSHNGYHLSKADYQELIRLNHLVMETANAIHNNHMMKKD